MNEEQIKNQINELIKDEIQEVINDYVDTKESTQESGLGFVQTEDEKELKVKVSKNEIDKIIKEYKKIKKVKGLTYLRSGNLDCLTSTVDH